MVLWHLVEHPQFPCELASRQPLTGRKGSDTEAPPTGVSATEGSEP
jgi:hypothetical protein